MKSPCLTSAVIGLAAISLFASAPPAGAQGQSPAPPDRQRACFHSRNINNFTIPDDRTVYLRVGVSDIWRLDLMSNCPELTFRRNLSFTRSGVGMICSPLDMTIRFNQRGARRVCPVSAMRRLTPEEAAALPRGVRP